MSLISRARKQKAVWWERKTGFSLTGDPSYEPSVIIDVRWTQQSKEIAKGNGKTVLTAHTVYVDRQLKEGDLLYLGSEDPLDAGEAIEPKEKIFPVIATEAIPNLKNTETLYIAYC